MLEKKVIRSEMDKDGFECFLLADVRTVYSVWRNKKPVPEGLIEYEKFPYAEKYFNKLLEGGE